MGTPKIRPARASEAAELSELAFRSKSHWGYSVQFMEACRQELRVPARHLADRIFRYCVAEMDNAIVGFYAIKVLPESAYELEALFVKPEFIGTGVGRHLIEHAKQNVRDLGARELLIQGDPNAERFYLAAGAVPIGKRESESIAGRYLPFYSIRL